MVGSMIKLPAVGKKNPNGGKTLEWDHKGRTDIRKIYISYDGVNTIWGMQFLYAGGGNILTSRLFGSWCFSSEEVSEPLGTIGKDHFHTINLNYPKEYITLVKIYEHNNGRVGIAIDTNSRKYLGPFSAASNYNPVCFYFGDDNQFGGFHGTIQDSSLASIGVYVRPNPEE